MLSPTAVPKNNIESWINPLHGDGHDNGICGTHRPGEDCMPPALESRFHPERAARPKRKPSLSGDEATDLFCAAITGSKEPGP
jgi:hypothetical protein